MKFRVDPNMTSVPVAIWLVALFWVRNTSPYFFIKKILVTATSTPVIVTSRNLMTPKNVATTFYKHGEQQ